MWAGEASQTSWRDSRNYGALGEKTEPNEDERKSEIERRKSAWAVKVASKKLTPCCLNSNA